MTDALDEGATERAVTRKVVVRVVLFLTLMYLLAQFDRGNIAFAQKQISSDLGMSDAVYGFGAGIFFIGYFLFEVPSNMILRRVGARVWLARIMVSWGLVVIGMLLVRDEVGFYVARFLLGAAEAGFFPGAVFYLTRWLPSARRGQVTAVLVSAGPVAYLLAGPLSGGLLSMDGLAGLRGWQWLFLVEGVVTVVVGVAAWFLLTEGPSRARWLSEHERTWLTTRIEAERDDRFVAHVSIARVAVQPRVLLLCAVYGLLQVVNAGLVFWLPAIVDRIGGLSTVGLTSLAVVPYAFQVIGLFLLGRSSDRHGRRRVHVFFGCVCMTVGLGVSAVVGPVAGLAALCLVFFGYGLLSVFWALASSFLNTTSAGAVGLAFINSVANLGGFAGPFLVGWLRQGTGSTVAALWVLAGAAALAAVLVLLVRESSRQPTAQGA
ncbi:MFS transporter [Pseudonocardia acaciae]|uniref:MFS transporter n=1 Tax=Pseudonocardia acaciae TaxID=551276 RepID=UPI00048C940C|nr:MFS transporter [Pseudonocardia acaciae]